MSPRRRRPALSPEDRALWRAATRDTVPLAEAARRGAEDTPLPLPEQPPPEQQAAEQPPPRPARARHDLAAAPAAAGRAARRTPASGDGGRRPAPVGLDLAPPDAAPLGRSAPGLDRRTARRLGRGEREPEARVDLHGMTAERAHRALERCIAAALARGQRLVLVITGKGGRAGTSPGGADAAFMRPPAGLLRREAPRWLRAGPHAGQIVGIFEAHPRHGGAGAFYVYLKRRR